MEVPALANLVRARDDLLTQVSIMRAREIQQASALAALAIQLDEVLTEVSNLRRPQAPWPGDAAGDPRQRGRGAIGLGVTDRIQVLLSGITKEQIGIEVAPWWNALVPKRAGYRSLSLDVFDADTLKANARREVLISDKEIENIEHVDLVGSASNIAELLAPRELLGAIDYVVSSHNFEHLPDPVKFIKGCETALKPGGVVSMAIPDRRASFDYFRPLSTTGDFLAAHFDGRTRPSMHTWFMQNSLHCRLFDGDAAKLGYSLADDPKKIRPLETLEDAYRAWVVRNEQDDGAYLDVHCWIFTPSSFRLILNDLRWLGVINMEIDSVTGPNENEFYARLVKRVAPTEMTREAFYAERAELLHQINDEAGDNSRVMVALRRQFDKTRLDLEDMGQAYR
jgi:SAM-dependent methyltransferase